MRLEIRDLVGTLKAVVSYIDGSSGQPPRNSSPSAAIRAELPSTTPAPNQPTQWLPSATIEGSASDPAFNRMLSPIIAAPDKLSSMTRSERVTAVREAVRAKHEAIKTQFKNVKGFRDEREKAMAVQPATLSRAELTRARRDQLALLSPSSASAFSASAGSRQAGGRGRCAGRRLAHRRLLCRVAVVGGVGAGPVCDGAERSDRRRGKRRLEMDESVAPGVMSATARRNAVAQQSAARTQDDAQGRS